MDMLARALHACNSPERDGEAAGMESSLLISLPRALSPGPSTPESLNPKPAGPAARAGSNASAALQMIGSMEWSGVGTGADAEALSEQ
jgi:hypothetical protein